MRLLFAPFPFSGSSDDLLGFQGPVSECYDMKQILGS